MYEINVKADFEAAHRVVNYPGKCDNLHGHSWIVEAFAKGEQLDDLGMLIDFKCVKKALNEILDRLDHRYINDIKPFSEGVNPTAENLAKYIFDEMEKLPIFDKAAKLSAVRVWESPRACVTYTRE